MTSFRAGVDIGGTFTDVVFAGSDGRVLVKKVASTPDDYGRAVLEGLALGIEELGISPSDVSEVGHGFTVATNAILEGKGEPTALITTEGFRDVLGAGPDQDAAPLRSVLPEAAAAGAARPALRGLRANDLRGRSAEAARPGQPRRGRRARRRDRREVGRDIAAPFVRQPGPRERASPRPSGPACPKSASRSPACCCPR